MMVPPPADRCEIARLPEDLLSATLALTTPRDACHAAMVSPAFRAAADADTVWSRWLPRDLPPIADGELDLQPTNGEVDARPTMKQIFMRLSDSARPLLLAYGIVVRYEGLHAAPVAPSSSNLLRMHGAVQSMWLDRDTAAKCYMLSARMLCIISLCDPEDSERDWRWIPITRSRFKEGAEFLKVVWLEMRGKIHCNILSQNTTYVVYMVFKMSRKSYGLVYPLRRAKVIITVTKSTHQVYLQGYDNEGEGHRVPQTRIDGWMEMEMGEFNNEEGEDDMVSINIAGSGGHWKKGLIVQGIEIRVKK